MSHRAVAGDVGEFVVHQVDVERDRPEPESLGAAHPAHQLGECGGMMLVAAVAGGGDQFVTLDAAAVLRRARSLPSSAHGTGAPTVRGSTASSSMLCCQSSPKS